MDALEARIAPAVFPVNSKADYKPRFNVLETGSFPIEGSLRKAISDARQSFLATQVTPTITFSTDPGQGTPFGGQGPANVIELDHGVLGPE